MKISRKRRQMILDAVSDAMLETMKEQLSSDEREELEHPPETWSSGTKEKFDLLSELEYRTCFKIEKVLDE